MADEIETYRGAIYPWHCDHQGHLTVMHYFGFFDHAAWQLITQMGFPRSRLDQERKGFVDVKATIEYQAEQHVGDCLHILSGLTKIGNTSIALRHRMFNSATQDLAATLSVIMLYFDLEARRKLPIPEADRARMESLLIASGG